jgi:glutamate-1-semialdehyde 2,1-aminomutase
MSATSNVSARSSERANTEEFYERASRVLAGKVGHDLRATEPLPLYIQRGAGSRKWDVDGKEYIDFLLGNGALLLGHADADVIAAVEAALVHGSHFGSDHPLHIEWAELVQSLVPCAERVRFVNSGSEATLLALRVARAYTKRNKILRFHGHFHGWHDDVVHGYNPPFDADGSLGVPPQVRDNMPALPDDDLNLVEDFLSRESDVAAAILEPSGASWGRVPIAPDFLRGLREITARLGVLLIFDEVVTGFRFSPGGAQQLYGVTPDLACLAKVIAGGMPGGAVVGSAEVMKLFDITGEPRHDRYERVTHLGTFNAAPVSAAAGIVALRKVATGEPTTQANNMAERLRLAWDRVLDRLGVAGYVYGPCSTFHVYFETKEERLREASSRKDLYTSEARFLKGMPPLLISEYQRLLRSNGVDVMSSTGGVLSAVHTDADIEEATAAFENTVAALLQKGLVRRL